MNAHDNTSLHSRPRPRFSSRLSAIGLVALLGLAACGSDDATSDVVGTDGPAAAADGEVTIADPWSRQPAEGQTASAVYGTVTNGTDEDITAIAASTDVAGTVELHQVTMNDEGQMSMSEKEGGYVIAAGESFTFEPGGPHIMLLDVDPATYPDTVDMTLEFDNGTTLDFTADVRALDADGEMQMDTNTDMNRDMEPGEGDMSD